MGDQQPNQSVDFDQVIQLLQQIEPSLTDSIQWSHNIYDAVSMFGSLLLGVLLGLICAKGMFDAWS